MGTLTGNGAGCAGQEVRSVRRTAATLTLAGVVSLSLAAVSLVAGPAGPAGASTPEWTTQAAYPPPPDAIAVSCATATDCVAVGQDSAIITTTDGGAVWNPGTLPGIDAGAELEAVSCRAADDCVTVGDDGAVFTTDGGSSWSTGSGVDTSSGLTAVSCASTVDCVAVGEVSAATDGGSTWSALPAPAGVFFESISCPSTSECVAVGEQPGGATVAEVTTDTGTTWTPVVLPVTAAEGGGVSCGSVSDCVIVGTPTPAPGCWSSPTAPAGCRRRCPQPSPN
ncbi:MAG: hypothetical protein ACLQPH_04580 [Acidimicrobiales bacterium]